jgi:hypothetical protein
MANSYVTIAHVVVSIILAICWSFSALRLSAFWSECNKVELALPLSLHRRPLLQQVRQALLSLLSIGCACGDFDRIAFASGHPAIAQWNALAEYKNACPRVSPK